MKLQWSAKALSDLHDLTREFESPRTTARIIQRLVAVPDVLAEFPRMGVVLADFAPREVRRFIVDDYEIRYELTDATLIVTDLFHTRQDREIFH